MNHRFHISPTDKTFAPTVQETIDNLNKPKGSLGKLEQLALQIALIQHTLQPTISHPCHLLFAADHGIEREGVSISPREVTWQQVENFCRGGGGVNLFCRQHHIALDIVDVGIDHDFNDETLSASTASSPDISPIRFFNQKLRYGTRNFLQESAMTEAEYDAALQVGIDRVNQCVSEGCNLLSIGEMGIANTSPSSVWMYFFQQIPLSLCIGMGSGLNEKGKQHKFEILQTSILNFMHREGLDSATPFLPPDGWSFHPELCERPYFPGYAEQIIRSFGGYEMVATIGAMLQAAELGITILVDGFIMTACMLAAAQLYPSVLNYAIFTHEGDEAGHRMMLQALGAKPLLSLGLRLGEGTGALCAFPLVDSAVRMLTQMDNFQHAHITKYF